MVGYPEFTLAENFGYVYRPEYVLSGRVFDVVFQIVSDSVVLEFTIDSGSKVFEYGNAALLALLDCLYD